MRNTALVIAAGILLVVLFGILGGTWLLMPTSVKAVQTEAQVDDLVGIKLDTDKMYFGTVQPGGTSRRWVSVRSEDDAFVVISMTGDIADHLKPDSNRFLVKGGEERSVLFVLRVPEDAQNVTMTGSAVIRTYRPLARVFIGQEK